MIKLTLAEMQPLWDDSKLWQGPDGRYRLDLDVVEGWYGVQPKEEEGGSIPVECSDGEFHPDGTENP